MPDLRFKVCTSCGKLRPVGDGSAMCEKCAREKSAKRVRKRNYAREYAKRYENEDKKYRAFYNSKEWRMVSLQYRVDKGHRCEKCGKIGTDVHHKEPIQTESGWKRRFDTDNLELLCIACHNKEHGRGFATCKGADE